MRAKPERLQLAKHRKLADMEKKIDALLRAQGLLSGDTNTAAPAAPEDESSTGPLEKK